jgi:G3E family GTPase
MVALEHMTAHYGPNLLRIKGIAHIREEPLRPVIIHGVQHLLHEMVWLDAWPSDDRRTRLIFVTRGIAREAIENFLADWLAGGERKTAAMLGLSDRGGRTTEPVYGNTTIL